MKQIRFGDTVPPPVRRLRRRLRAARRWSVMTGLTGGATAVLLPYQGIGAVDAIWAALFGGSAVLAALRWVDYRHAVRELSQESSRFGPQGTSALAAEAQTIAGELATKLRGARTAVQYRRTTIAESYRRLETAAATWQQLAPRLAEPTRGETAPEVEAADVALRELAEQVRGVEKAMSLSPDRRAGLADTHRLMVTRFGDGVCGYEDLVSAAAMVVAEQAALDGATGVPDPVMSRLREAAERLAGLADGIVEMRRMHT